jgi:hypothetical protein
LLTAAWKCFSDPNSITPDNILAFGNLKEQVGLNSKEILGSINQETLKSFLAIMKIGPQLHIQDILKQFKEL